MILFDQRNCGRSTPHASDPAADLSQNTTPNLLADIERLRQHLGIGKWLVYGASWGVTLALAYAETWPERVSAMVLSAVTTTRRSEIDWLYQGLRRFFPEQWERFAAVAAPEDRHDVVAAYNRLLNGPDAARREPAARAWCDWEDAIVKLDPSGPPNPRYADPRFRIAFARIVTHYFSRNAWLADGQLLSGAPRLAGIPGTLIHGRLDLTSAVETAWELHRAWPGSELILTGSGHLASEPAMTGAIVAATDRFRRLA